MAALSIPTNAGHLYLFLERAATEHLSFVQLTNARNQNDSAIALGSDLILSPVCWCAPSFTAVQDLTRLTRLQT
eukprot:3027342-Amphidinium_carterae.1